MLLLHPETIMTIRDGEPRTATSIFTQLLSSAVAPDIQIDRYRYIYVCLCGIHQLSTPLSHKSPAPEATLTVVTLTATRPGLRALWANWTAVKLNLSLVDWGSLFCSELKPSISRWCLFVVVVVCISNSVCLFLCVCVCVWVKLTWPENCFSVMTVTSRKAIG